MSEAPVDLRSRSPWWAAALVLPLLLVSDFRVRSRAVTDSTAGIPDLVVVVEVLVYAAVGAWVAVQLLRHPARLPARPLPVLAWGFAATYAASALWAPYAVLGTVRAVQLVVIAGVGHALALWAGARELHRVLHGLLVVVAAATVVGIVTPVAGPALAFPRFSWLAVHPVVAGSYLGVAVVLSVAYLVLPDLRREAPRWPPVAYLGLALLLGHGLVENRSRGSLAAAAAGLTLVLLVGVRRRHRLDVLLGGALLLVTALVVAWSPLLVYLRRGASTADLAGLNFRTTLWSQAVELWRDQPLGGLGLGATRGVFLESTGLGGGHNALVNVLVDGGLLTAVVWSALLLALAAAIARARRPNGASLTALLLGVLAFLLVQGLTFEGLGASANGALLLLYVLVGSTLGLARPAAPARLGHGGPGG